MIKELTENPNKKFNCKNEKGNYVSIQNGVLCWEDGKEFHLNTGFKYGGTLEIYEWEEVKEPVSFIEAVRSGKQIRYVGWYTAYSPAELGDLLYDLTNYNAEKIRELLLGQWYIED